MINQQTVFFIVHLKLFRSKNLNFKPILKAKMQTKFNGHLERIQRVLDKMDREFSLGKDENQPDLYCGKIDKAFELHEICGEEICQQLHFLELEKHSFVLRKIFHMYKHHVFNLLRINLSLQEYVNMKDPEIVGHSKYYMPRNLKIDPHLRLRRASSC